LKKKRASIIVPTLVIAVLTIAFAVTALVVSRPQEGGEHAPERPERQTAQQNAAPEKLFPERDEDALAGAIASASASARAQKAKPQEKPPTKGVLVIIIDDAGNNLHELDAFLKFPGALTFSVLPALPLSKDAAAKIRAAGKDVMLHQPMENVKGKYPGPGCIYNKMSPAEAAALLDKNIDELWPISAVNNHEGSLVSANLAIMKAVITECQSRGVPFLDSRTTADTAAPKAAKELGIKIFHRDIFLDDVEKEAEIQKYFDQGLAKAAKTGSAVMIGHSWSPLTAKVLNERYAKLAAEGWKFESVKSFIDRGPSITSHTSSSGG
jgi:polysaccharide deacetylase 2 family uncharacterized protein YibQ